MADGLEENKNVREHFLPWKAQVSLAEGGGRGVLATRKQVHLRGLPATIHALQVSPEKKYVRVRKVGGTAEELWELVLAAQPDMGRPVDATLLCIDLTLSKDMFHRQLEDLCDTAGHVVACRRMLMGLYPQSVTSFQRHVGQLVRENLISMVEVAQNKRIFCALSERFDVLDDQLLDLLCNTILCSDQETRAVNQEKQSSVKCAELLGQWAHAGRAAAEQKAAEVLAGADWNQQHGNEQLLPMFWACAISIPLHNKPARDWYLSVASSASIPKAVTVDVRDGPLPALAVCYDRRHAQGRTFAISNWAEPNEFVWTDIHELEDLHLRNCIIHSTSLQSIQVGKLHAIDTRFIGGRINLQCQMIKVSLTATTISAGVESLEEYVPYNVTEMKLSGGCMTAVMQVLSAVSRESLTSLQLVDCDLQYILPLNLAAFPNLRWLSLGPRDVSELRDVPHFVKTSPQLLRGYWQQRRDLHTTVCSFVTLTVIGGAGEGKSTFVDALSRRLADYAQHGLPASGRTIGQSSSLIRISTEDCKSWKQYLKAADLNAQGREMKPEGIDVKVDEELRTLFLVIRDYGGQSTYELTQATLSGGQRRSTAEQVTAWPPIALDIVPSRADPARDDLDHVGTTAGCAVAPDLHPAELGDFASVHTHPNIPHYARHVLQTWREEELNIGPLFALVFDITDWEAKTRSRLKYWLDRINLANTSANVILVATNLDGLLPEPTDPVAKIAAAQARMAEALAICQEWRQHQLRTLWQAMQQLLEHMHPGDGSTLSRIHTSMMNGLADRVRQLARISGLVMLDSCSGQMMTSDTALSWQQSSFETHTPVPILELIVECATKEPHMQQLYPPYFPKSLAACVDEAGYHDYAQLPRTHQTVISKCLKSAFVVPAADLFGCESFCPAEAPDLEKEHLLALAIDLGLLTQFGRDPLQQPPGQLQRVATPVPGPQRAEAETGRMIVLRPRWLQAHVSRLLFNVRRQFIVEVTDVHSVGGLLSFSYEANCRVHLKSLLARAEEQLEAAPADAGRVIEHVVQMDRLHDRLAKHFSTLEAPGFWATAFAAFAEYHLRDTIRECCRQASKARQEKFLLRTFMSQAGMRQMRSYIKAGVFFSLQRLTPGESALLMIPSDNVESGAASTNALQTLRADCIRYLRTGILTTRLLRRLWDQCTDVATTNLVQCCKEIGLLVEHRQHGVDGLAVPEADAGPLYFVPGMVPWPRESRRESMAVQVSYRGWWPLGSNDNTIRAELSASKTPQQPTAQPRIAEVRRRRYNLCHMPGFLVPLVLSEVLRDNGSKMQIVGQPVRTAVLLRMTRAVPTPGFEYCMLCIRAQAPEPRMPDDKPVAATSNEDAEGSSHLTAVACALDVMAWETEHETKDGAQQHFSPWRPDYPRHLFNSVVAAVKRILPHMWSAWGGAVLDSATQSFTLRDAEQVASVHCTEEQNGVIAVSVQYSPPQRFGRTLAADSSDMLTAILRLQHGLAGQRFHQLSSDVAIADGELIEVVGNDHAHSHLWFISKGRKAMEKEARESYRDLCSLTVPLPKDDAWFDVSADSDVELAAVMPNVVCTLRAHLSRTDDNSVDKLVSRVSQLLQFVNSLNNLELTLTAPLPDNIVWIRNDAGVEEPRLLSLSTVCRVPRSATRVSASAAGWLECLHRNWSDATGYLDCQLEQEVMGVAFSYMMECILPPLSTWRTRAETCIVQSHSTDLSARMQNAYARLLPQLQQNLALPLQLKPGIEFWMTEYGHKLPPLVTFHKLQKLCISFLQPCEWPAHQHDDEMFEQLVALRAEMGSIAADSFNRPVIDLVNWNLLHAAAAGGHVQLVRRLLLECGMDANAVGGRPEDPRDQCRGNALKIAQSFQRQAAAECLESWCTLQKCFGQLGTRTQLGPEAQLISDIAQNATKFYGVMPAQLVVYNRLVFPPLARTLLHAAAAGGRLLVVQWLVEEHGMDPSFTDANGQTAVQLAEEARQAQVVMWLAAQSPTSRT